MNKDITSSLRLLVVSVENISHQYITYVAYTSIKFGQAVCCGLFSSTFHPDRSIPNVDNRIFHI